MEEMSPNSFSNRSIITREVPVPVIPTNLYQGLTKTPPRTQRRTKSYSNSKGRTENTNRRTRSQGTPNRPYTNKIYLTAKQTADKFRKLNKIKCNDSVSCDKLARAYELLQHHCDDALNNDPTYDNYKRTDKGIVNIKTSLCRKIAMKKKYEQSRARYLKVKEDQQQKLISAQT
jgi:hypothetical protein